MLYERNSKAAGEDWTTTTYLFDLSQPDYQLLEETTNGVTTRYE